MSALSSAKKIPIDQELITLLSSGGLDIGPVNIYLGDRGLSPDEVAASGTVVATASKVLTGTLTKFTTEFKAGQFILIGANVKPNRIKEITDDFSMTLYEEITTDPGGETIARVHLLPMGATDATVLSLSTGKTDLKASQYGDGPADKALSTSRFTVKFGLAAPNADQTAAAIQGLVNEFDDDGKLVEQFWRPKMGQRDSQIAKTLWLVRLLEAGVGARESDDPMDIWRVYKAAPMVEAEVTRDPVTQVFWATTYEGYIDEIAQKMFSLGNLATVTA